MKKLLVYLGILRTLSWNLRRKMQWIGQSCSSQACEPEEIRGSATCFAYNLLGGHSRFWSKVYSWQSPDSAPPQVQSQVWLSLPGNMTVTDNRPWAPGSHVFHFHLLLLLFCPEPCPVTHTSTPRACLGSAYFENPVWTLLQFWPWLPSFHLQILCHFSIPNPQLWLSCSPRLVGLLQTCQAPISLVRGPVTVLLYWTGKKGSKDHSWEPAECPH